MTKPTEKVTTNPKEPTPDQVYAAFLRTGKVRRGWVIDPQAPGKARKRKE